MLLSIIVPVYNVEEYIEECILSLLRQTLKEIEIIVVNDGTKDKSIDIVRKFNDNRIKIINQDNKGLSGARNTGLRVARGEFIAFVDSDDFIINELAYEEMYKIAEEEKSDIVAGNCIWYYSDENNYPMQRNMNLFKNSPMKSEEYFISCMKSNRIYAPVWLNIYRRKFLLDNKLVFMEGVYHEDEEFTPRALIKANKVSIYDNEFYLYRKRQGSITNSKISFNEKRCNDIFKIYESLQNVISEIDNEELKFLFRKYATSFVFCNMFKYRVKYVPPNIKKLIKDNAVTKGQKIRSVLINLDETFFIVAENILRKTKRKN